MVQEDKEMENKRKQKTWYIEWEAPNRSLGGFGGWEITIVEERGSYENR